MIDYNVFEGKVAFVAGGTSGINLEIAKNYARYGASVAVMGRNPEKAAAAAEEIRTEVSGARALGLSADVRDPEQVDAALQMTVSEFGKLNIVVSGAAGNFLASAVDLSPKGFKTVVDIDLLGTYNVFHLGFQYLEKEGASLIAITAPGAVQPHPQQVHANAAKAGVNMLIKCLALEWGPAGIRVNGICPGAITGTEGASRLFATEERQLLEPIALRRWGEKREIADAAVFLSSPNGSYISGTILDVDGGMLLGDASNDCLTPTVRPQ